MNLTLGDGGDTSIILQICSGKGVFQNISEVHPDRNGFVRSVRLVSRGTYKVRPIAKICLLEGASQPCRPDELDANDNTADKHV